MGRRPLAREFSTHKGDAGPLSEAHELTFKESVQLTTAQEDLRTRDAALVLQELTLPPMSREVLNSLGIHGVVAQHLHIDRGGDNRLLRLSEVGVGLGRRRSCSQGHAKDDQGLVTPTVFEAAHAEREERRRNSRHRTVLPLHRRRPTTLFRCQ